MPPYLLITTFELILIIIFIIESINLIIGRIINRFVKFLRNFNFG